MRRNGTTRGGWLGVMSRPVRRTISPPPIQGGPVKMQQTTATIDRKPVVLWLTNLASPYRRPVWEALARHVDLDVRLLENDDRLGRDVDANRGSDWVADRGEGYRLKSIRAVRVARKEARFYALLSLPRVRVSAVLLGGWESPAYWQVLLWAKLTGARTVGFYESILHTQNFPHGIVARMRALYFSSLDAVVVPGTAAREALLSMGVPSERIVTGFNAVDGRRLAEAARRQRKVLDAQSPPGHHYAYVGQLIERKGVDMLIDAFAAVREPGDSLAIYGRGNLRDDLRRRSARLGVDDAVSFEGYVLNERIPEALADKHTLILPSRQEVWGLVVNEALAVGMHAVVSDVAGVAPSVERMRGVYLSRPTVESIVEEMRRSRDEWMGPVQDPEILKFGPAEFAEKFRVALVPSSIR